MSLLRELKAQLAQKDARIAALEAERDNWRTAAQDAILREGEAEARCTVLEKERDIAVARAEEAEQDRDEGREKELDYYRSANAQRQRADKAEQERDEYRTLAKVGTWHAECRPNRQQAARELQKSQAIIDKLADTISAKDATLTAIQALPRYRVEIGGMTKTVLFGPSFDYVRADDLDRLLPAQTETPT